MADLRLELSPTPKPKYPKWIGGTFRTIHCSQILIIISGAWRYKSILQIKKLRFREIILLQVTQLVRHPTKDGGGSDTGIVY